MINIPIMIKTVERVVRMVPVVKDLLPANKDGLNSLIQPESTSQVTKLENIIHNKNAEIFNLRQERKDMKRMLFSNNEKLKEVEAIVEEYRNALLKKEIYSGKPFK